MQGGADGIRAELGLGAPGHKDPSAPPTGWYSRGYLPHYNNPHTLQSVTFRLADSLPQSKLKELEREIHDGDSTKSDAARRKKIESWLDAGMGCCALNYLLLEIHEAKQWRNQYQSLEDFAQIEAGISESQLRKCIDSATVMIDMVEAGMEHIAPKGRQIEEVIKVPRSYRPKAWRHVRKVFERDGRSTDTTTSALRDYCRDRDLTFGRRKPNGSKNIGLPSLVRTRGRVLNKTRDARQKSNEADWLGNLSSSEELILSKLHYPTSGEETNSDPTPEISVTRSIQVLTTIASTQATRNTTDGMAAVLALIAEKNPNLANNLVNVALSGLHEL